MIIGFTGTRIGMTYRQKHVVEGILYDFFEVTQDAMCDDPDWTFEFHHGDCVGADEQFHNMVFEWGKVIIHPPEFKSMRAFCKSDYILPPKPYLERNHDIVDASELMIATPKESEEILRSGTWATVRYARKKKKIVIVVYPDGRLGE